MVENKKINRKLYFSITYLLVGFCIIIWSYYTEFKFGPESDGALGSLWLLAILAAPISIPFSALMFDILNRSTINITFIPMLLILMVGYLQWFYFFPWAMKKIRKRKM